MDQKLAEQNPPKRQIKIGTQQYKIQQIWKNLSKTSFEKESDELIKKQLKGELYTKVSSIYEKQEGVIVKRSTIRRCVNSLTKQAK